MTALELRIYEALQILHQDFNCHTYKVVVVQAANNQDMVTQKNVRKDILKAVGDNNIMTDDTNFHLCGHVNIQDSLYWTTANTRDIHQETLCSEKVIVWCGVASFGSNRPYFFADGAGRAVTVNSARYIKMLCTFLEPELQRLCTEIQTLQFQQDTATAHTARNAM